MTPLELWNVIGQRIAERCRCQNAWHLIDGTTTPRGPVTLEEADRVFHDIETTMFEAFKVSN